MKVAIRRMRSLVRFYRKWTNKGQQNAVKTQRLDNSHSALRVRDGETTNGARMSKLPNLRIKLTQVIIFCPNRAKRAGETTNGAWMSKLPNLHITQTPVIIPTLKRAKAKRIKVDKKEGPRLLESI